MARERTVQHDFYVYVDVAVLTVSREKGLEPKHRLHALVMHRPDAERGKWALPGGLVGDDEDLPDTAVRIVKRETGLTIPKSDLIHVGAYGRPGRDSRFRAISIAFAALVPEPETPVPQEHSDDARFVSYRQLRDSKVLEFDHRTIIRDARRAARQQLEDTPIALKFCNDEFTLTERSIPPTSDAKWSLRKTSSYPSTKSSASKANQAAPRASTKPARRST